MGSELAALKSELESERASIVEKKLKMDSARLRINELDGQIRDIDEKKFLFADLVREIDQSRGNLESLSIQDRSTQIEEFEKKLTILRIDEMPSAIEEDEALVSEAADLTLKLQQLDLKLGHLQVGGIFLGKDPLESPEKNSQPCFSSECNDNLNVCLVSNQLLYQMTNFQNLLRASKR